MAKKRKSAFAIYFTTILITLVLAGSTALFVYVKVTNMPKNPATTSTTTDELGKYLPEVEQNQTILFILNGGETKTDTVFMLVRFLATEDKLILTPISGKTFAQINTKKSTVFDFYSKGGYLQAVDAVASATNVPVDKYVNFNKETFNTFIGVFGGVRFKVPEDVTYENPVTGEKTAIKA
ncbi:MAG: LCP family protein, partial [Oscillospiraceae bacterium]